MVNILFWKKKEKKDVPVCNLPRASDRFQQNFKNSCPILEYTADGDCAGICWRYLTNGICPKHGRVK